MDGQLALARGLVDFGRLDDVGRDADPLQQVEPARRSGSEDQAQPATPQPSC
jgi:hypothetical protein